MPESAPLPERISVPLGVKSAVYFLDESGSKGSSGDFFVMAALKTNDPDRLTRDMEVIRHRSGIRQELKFGQLTHRSVPVFRQLVDLLSDSGSMLGAFVIHKRTFDPFAEKPLWEAHAWASATLVKGMTSRRELATLLMDGISTPKDVAYGSHVRDSINQRFKTTRVVAAISLDSRTCDGLQLADLVASAIAYERKTVASLGRDAYAESSSPKAQISRYLCRAFDRSTFADCKTARVRIMSAHAPGQRTGKPGLAIAPSVADT